MTDKSILIVEDEPQLRFMMSQFLKEDGWETHQAGSARAAKTLLSRLSEIPKVLLFDLNLEKSYAGMELAREIVSTHPETKVVICSGGFSDFLDHPVQFAYLHKPFRVERFLEVVNDLARLADDSLTVP